VLQTRDVIVTSRSQLNNVTPNDLRCAFIQVDHHFILYLLIMPYPKPFIERKKKAQSDHFTLNEQHKTNDYRGEASTT
jgi:hypothetical protein